MGGGAFEGGASEDVSPPPFLVAHLKRAGGNTTPIDRSEYEAIRELVALRMRLLRSRNIA